jgi:hypothetical protein
VPGAIVDMSMNSVPGFAPSSACPIMSSTWSPSTTIVMTTSEASATALGESTTVPPCSEAHASAFSRVRLNTVSSTPALARFMACSEPMIPSPMNPTFSAIAAASRCLYS